MQLNSRGSLLLNTMILMAAAAAIGYISLSVLHVGYNTVVTEERRIEAEALSNDILELTKYLLFYESIFYTDKLGPWNHTGARGTNILNLLGVGMGAISDTDIDFFKACGGFDAKGRQIGTFKIQNIPVFCPLYERSSLLSGLMLDQMVLQPLQQAGVLTMDSPGQYTLDVVYFDRDKGIDAITNNADHWIDINAGQNLIKGAQQYLQRAVGHIRILSTDAGFSAPTPERYIEVSSDVSLAGTANMVYFKRRQSLLLYPSTPRDFALFMVYPTKSDGVTRTSNWSESVKITPDSLIEGRVFFNGNFDVAPAALPTFTEMVVLTGDFVTPLSKADRQSLPTKFLKGLVTNYSAPRYLYSGNCSASDPTLTLANGSRFRCVNNKGGTFTIQDYMQIASHACIDAPITSTDGAVTVDCSKSANPSCSSVCVPKIVSGTRSTVNLAGTYSVIAAPAAVVRNTAGNVYGTILGGYFQSNNKVHIASMAQVKVGMPGIGSPDTLSSYTSSFQTAIDGIGVPLQNLPIVYIEGVSR
jgi:hypothetical protein